jgi:hypothetical protein
MATSGQTCTMRAATAVLTLAAFGFAACGQEDFANNPRPATAVELTGVIQEDKVTVSPRKLGAGPVTITVSNQTDDDHTLTLVGDRTKTEIGPINPLDTGTIQKTLEPGIYEIKAGSAKAVSREIKPAQLEIGKERKSSADEVGLP